VVCPFVEGEQAAKAVRVPPDALELFGRVQDGLRFEHGQGLSLVQWCERLVYGKGRRGCKGRRHLAATWVLGCEGWLGIEIADRVLRGLPWHHMCPASMLRLRSNAVRTWWCR